MAEYDMKSNLKRSHDYEDAPWWGRVYDQTLGEVASIKSVRKDGWFQRAGCDRVVTLADGKVFYVDEKITVHDYGTFALEYLSDVDRGVPGWVAKDSMCDFIAYAIPPLGKCWLLNHRQLRRAWDKFGDSWLSEFKHRESSSRSGDRKWRTHFCPVPRMEVLRKLCAVMLARFEA